jgi:hypothetical protein
VLDVTCLDTKATTVFLPWVNGEIILGSSERFSIKWNEDPATTASDFSTFNLTASPCRVNW